MINEARDEDTETGRWTTLDPSGFTAGDVNLFRYAGDNPTNATDPSGLIGIFCDGAGQPKGSGTIIDTIANSYKEEHYIYQFPLMDNSVLPQVKDASDKVEKAIDKAKKAGRTEPVDIFGWSRGGIAALLLMRRLKNLNVKIRFLGLIDPVFSGLPLKEIRYLYPGEEKMTDRDLLKLPDQEAVITDNVEDGFVAWTPSKDSTLSKTVFSFRIKLKLQDEKNDNIWFETWDKVIHEKGGFDGLGHDIGYWMWYYALTAKVPLGQNPYKKL